ncbi:aldehyde dehydrogenase [Choiromyces venosus 120613-1]|uniref:Aldehyde dehydrogenase n=1 Tax=Choiromyces venosus 120613-1 TaxID=1336337 RepID=A0A3N4JGB3_9PEZI|nr:aldehyde dehydrogenase [Choiromyces venosus 120613-1]
MTYTVPFLINNEEITSSKTFDVKNPLDDSLLWTSSAATVQDVEAAIQAASNAFRSWSTTKLVKRRELINKLADVFEERGQELMDSMEKETAALSGWADSNVHASAGLARDVASRVVTIAGTIPESVEEGRTALVQKEPYGVVLAIAPWNAPVILSLRAVLFPIAAGNAVILKSSEISPKTHYLIASFFKEAGFPPGVLNVICHAREDAPLITNTLIAHKAIRKINFTGSTPVGKMIAAKAGENLKPILLELGGKAPLIVLADADIKKAAGAAAIGSYLHSGQICMATEKIIVHDSILEEFIIELIDATKQFGETQALVLPGALEKLNNLIESAVNQGAKVVNPPKEMPSRAKFPNLIIRDVTREMELYHVESFGPLATIISASSEEEAISVANDTQFGLSAAIFTADLARGLKIARRIESGAVHINGMTVHDEPSLPHGGVKESGFGRFGSSWGIEEFLTTKTVTFIS